MRKLAGKGSKRAPNVKKDASFIEVAIDGMHRAGFSHRSAGKGRETKCNTL